MLVTTTITLVITAGALLWSVYSEYNRLGKVKLKYNQGFVFYPELKLMSTFSQIELRNNNKGHASA